MDRARILEILTDLRDITHLAELCYERANLEERVEAIAAQHEAEVAAALAHHADELRVRDQLVILPCGHHASNAVMDDQGARCEMCDLKAQVAVMSEALRTVLELTDHDDGEAYKSDWLRIEFTIDKALSASPRALWSGKVQLLYSEEEPCLCILPNQAFDLASGHEHHILILAHEQGQESLEEK